MKDKSSFKLNIFLLIAALSIVTGIAYAGWLTHALNIWFVFIFFVAFLVLFAYTYDILIVRFKWGVPRVLLLIFGVIMISALVTQSVWTIVIPSWLFTVTTNKSTYRLGENVTITASLKNTGFITHSFKSKVSNPMLISIVQLIGPGGTSRIGVWWNPPWKENATEFSLMPNQSLERSFIWNQTNISTPWFWNQTYMPGTYTIEAFIPDPKAEVISPSWDEVLFIAGISINVTSS